VNALQPWHIILVVLVCLILFGSKKLPDAARGLGRSLRIFKSEVNEMNKEGKADDDPHPELPPGSVESSASTTRSESAGRPRPPG
jgi:sec-independent protein translocase protein TatA